MKIAADGKENRMEPLVLSQADAMKLLKTNPETIQRYLLSGELPAYKEGRNWKIPLESLKNFTVDKALKEAEARRNRTGE